MNADLVIKNASLVIPNSQVIEADIAVSGRKIVAWARIIDIAAREEFDARGQTVIPGIIDPHVHLGIFGDLAAEAETETAAALAGGVTTLGCYVSSDDSYERAIPDWAAVVLQRSRTDIFIHPVVRTDYQLNELPSIIQRFGLASFKVYMWGLPGITDAVDDGFLLDVFSVAEEASGIRVCIHAENPQLIKRAEKRLGAQIYSVRGTLADWEKTHPGIAESEAVARASHLARDTGAKLYFVHISSGETVEVLARLDREMVAAETTSPYLTLDAATQDGNLAKMVPPIRHATDCDALWRGLLAGELQTIGTDNTTLTRAEKRADGSVWNALPGYPVLGTHLPVMIEEGYHRRGIELPKLIGWMTENPARIFGLYPQKGTLLPGSDADLVVLDLHYERAVDARKLGSRSDFSLYEGQRLRGWPTLVVKGGRIVFRDGIGLSDHREGSVRLLHSGARSS